MASLPFSWAEKGTHQKQHGFLFQNEELQKKHSPFANGNPLSKTFHAPSLQTTVRGNKISKP